MAHVSLAAENVRALFQDLALARKIHEAVGFGVLRGSDVGSLGARRT